MSRCVYYCAVLIGSHYSRATSPHSQHEFQKGTLLTTTHRRGRWSHLLSGGFSGAIKHTCSCTECQCNAINLRLNVNIYLFDREMIKFPIKLLHISSHAVPEGATKCVCSNGLIELKFEESPSQSSDGYKSLLKL